MLVTSSSCTNNTHTGLVMLVTSSSCTQPRSPNVVIVKPYLNIFFWQMDLSARFALVASGNIVRVSTLEEGR